MSEDTQQENPPAKKPDAKPAAARKKTEPDPYKDYDDAEAFSHVMTLATGELVGTTSTADTEHYSPKLKRNVPVTGVRAQ